MAEHVHTLNATEAKLDITGTKVSPKHGRQRPINFLWQRRTLLQFFLATAHIDSIFLAMGIFQAEKFSFSFNFQIGFESSEITANETGKVRHETCSSSEHPSNSVLLVYCKKHLNGTFHTLKRACSPVPITMCVVTSTYFIFHKTCKCTSETQAH